ncbi:hypothetical protein D9611_013111 [Ephemerocybe angulata]|uniref:Uncharacterized protein n=1 Tax=Ephemerocybe angulata TaxID=980116 RepID=A0A8H5FC61_9AGAR|nr:hypothetical protein D9611_013111 [Tulosesus angulatus]
MLRCRWHRLPSLLKITLNSLHIPSSLRGKTPTSQTKPLPHPSKLGPSHPTSNHLRLDHQNQHRTQHRIVSKPWANDPDPPPSFISTIIILSTTALAQSEHEPDTILLIVSLTIEHRTPRSRIQDHSLCKIPINARCRPIITSIAKLGTPRQPLDRSEWEDIVGKLSNNVLPTRNSPDALRTT